MVRALPRQIHDQETCKDFDVIGDDDMSTCRYGCRACHRITSATSFRSSVCKKLPNDDAPFRISQLHVPAPLGKDGSGSDEGAEPRRHDSDAVAKRRGSSASCEWILREQDGRPLEPDA
jgi:hypothetical protein